MGAIMFPELPVIVYIYRSYVWRNAQITGAIVLYELQFIVYIVCMFKRCAVPKFVQSTRPFAWMAASSGMPRILKQRLGVAKLVLDDCSDDQRQAISAAQSRAIRATVQVELPHMTPVEIASAMLDIQKIAFTVQDQQDLQNVFVPVKRSDLQDFRHIEDCFTESEWDVTLDAQHTPERTLITFLHGKAQALGCRWPNEYTLKRWSVFVIMLKQRAMQMPHFNVTISEFERVRNISKREFHRSVRIMRPLEPPLTPPPAIPGKDDPLFLATFPALGEQPIASRIQKGQIDFFDNQFRCRGAHLVGDHTLGTMSSSSSAFDMQRPAIDLGGAGIGKFAECMMQSMNQMVRTLMSPQQSRFRREGSFGIEVLDEDGQSQQDRRTLQIFRPPRQQVMNHCEHIQDRPAINDADVETSPPDRPKPSVDPAPAPSKAPEAFVEETSEENGGQLQKLLAAFGTSRKSQKAKATAAKPAKSSTALKRPAGAKEQDSPALKRRAAEEQDFTYHIRFEASRSQFLCCFVRGVPEGCTKFKVFKFGKGAQFRTKEDARIAAEGHGKKHMRKSGSR